MSSSLFLQIVKAREQLITVFKIIYGIIILYGIVGTWSIYQVNDASIFFFSTAKLLGQISIILFVLTLIPGISRRFRKNFEVVSALMIFRRYIGIAMYLLVAIHSWHLIGIDVLKGFLPPVQFYLFSGNIAFWMLSFMAITSNDIATKKLGIWWNRIHNLTYILLWFIFFHTALRQVSIWTVITGVTGIVVILSHLYAKYKK